MLCSFIFTGVDFKLPGCHFKWLYVNPIIFFLIKISFKKGSQPSMMMALWWYIFDDVNVVTKVTSWKHNIDVIRLMHTRIKYAISPLLLGNFNSNKEQIARKRLNSLKMWTTEIWKKLPEGPKSHDAGHVFFCRFIHIAYKKHLRKQ